jgi:transcriptional regulator with XRE-family HTH domain
MHDPIQIRKRLGELIRRLREQRGWSQEELANATGFGRSFTSSIERGTKDVRISTLVKLANIFGIHLSQLFRSDSQTSGRTKS